MYKFNLEQHLMGMKRVQVCFSVMMLFYEMMKGFVNLQLYFYYGMISPPTETLNA